MRRFRITFIVLGFLLFIASILVSPQVYSYFQPATGEGRYILLRLEDVGPGDFYGTPEGIGKLKAVLGYLQEQNVPYHIAVVPRWKRYSEQGGWQEAGIDTPTPVTALFVQVLREAQSQGAILGMHGYSHQFGDSPRADGHHNSGFGNEFKVPGENTSESPAYAAERIEKSLRAFQLNGLKPAFWESPHYNSTPGQQKVFRSYMGLIYEPNKLQLRSLRDIVYVQEENDWIRSSNGSVYIPAPLRYIFNQERVQEILDKLKDYDGLASLYYHPYLEFSYLEPVMKNGEAVSQNGLPLYQYKAGESSPLHKLVEGIKTSHYRFGTIHDVVPFSPAHRVMTASHLKEGCLLTGDVNGDGKDDWVGIDTNRGQAIVTLSNLEWPRNRKTGEASNWLHNEMLKQKSVFLLMDSNGDKQMDLLQIRDHELLLFKNQSGSFRNEPENVTLPTELQSLLKDKQGKDVKWVSGYQKSNHQSLLVRLELKQHKGQTFVIENLSLVSKGVFEIPSSIALTLQTQAFLGDVDGNGYADLILIDPNTKQVWVMKGQDSQFAAPEIWYSSSHGERASAADYNGDGKTDLLFYDRNGIWQVVHSNGSKFERMPASFGPWAQNVNGMPVSGDWDGNGKADIGLYDPNRSFIDAALSYQD
ncbi:DUF2334 domain-containing protein [Effusibacillus consociatus]|uniref:DUF2334 domain-containing protein n=1 Tax=Effusibacillus consociatus TaxID=1117041 RepID=A0ABV9PZF0_9BACL